MRCSTSHEKKRARGLSRRSFIARAAAAAAAPCLVPASVLGLGGAAAPSERIGVGFISCGGRAMNHVEALVGNPRTQILAVCDPYKSKREAARKLVEERYSRPGGAA